MVFILQILGSSSDDSNNIVLVSGEGDSMLSCINLINSYIGKEINLSHCSIIIFSEEYAKNGIGSEVLSLLNNEEVRPSTNLIISKCTAYEYLKNSNPNIEKLSTKYYDTFSITSRFTGYISDATIGNFYNNLSSDSCDSVAILGGLNSTARKKSSEESSSSYEQNSSSDSQQGDSSNENSGSEETPSSDSSSSSSSESSSQSSSNSESSTNSSGNSQGSSSQNSNTENVITNQEDLTAGTSSIVGKRGTENFGIAVFNKDKFRGELSIVETLCHLLILDRVDSCSISIDNPVEEGEKLELQLFPSKKPKISVDIKDDIPIISIKLFVSSDVLTLNQNVNYESNEILDKISDATKSYLEDELNKYLNKISKEYESDIDSFCNYALGHFATIPEWENFDWREKYKNAQFNVDIDVNVISSVLITKT